MADVREKVEQIRQAVYGKDVRESIASGIEAINTDIDALNDLVDALDSRVDTIITTPISGEAAAQEIVDARVSAVKSKTFATLDARFEEMEQDIATHKADNVTDDGGVHGLEIESGEFTPFLYGATVSGSNSYASQLGVYTKINDMIFFNIRLHISEKDAAMDGQLRVGGLPVNSKNLSGYRASVSIGILNAVSYGTYKEITAVINENSNFINLNKTVDNMSSTQQALLPADVGAFFIGLSGFYKSN